MVQIARPDEDISVGSWISSATFLWETLDEAIPNDDTDKITDNAVDTTGEVGLTSLEDPVGNVGHFIRFTMKGTGSGPPERCLVQLIEGTTVRASTGNQTSRGSWAQKVYELSAVEADAITAYTDLRLRIISSNLGGGEIMEVTQVEFEVPDAPSGGAIPVLLASYRQRRV